MGQFYQGSNLTFGKNRVQYKEFVWSYFKGKKADVFFYLGGDKMALETAILSDQILDELEVFLNYSPTERIQILTFLKHADFRQSNIGILDAESELMGESQLFQGKLFVYFENDQESFEIQLKEGISKIALQEVLFGGSWKESIKSNALLAIPEWFSAGAAAWMAGLSADHAQTFMFSELNSQKKNINFWKGSEARVGGAAFWHFIENRYGRQLIPSIIHMSRFSQSVDNGFNYVVGKSLDQLIDEFYDYYRNQFAKVIMPTDSTIPDRKREMGIGIRSKQKFNYSNFVLAKDGKHWAFVTHELGQYRIWIYDVEKHHSKCIVKTEPRLDRLEDESFPSLCWHPNSEYLYYFFEKSGNLYLSTYQLTDQETSTKQIFKVDKVFNPVLSQDGKTIVFSGVVGGKVDMYLLPVTANTPKQITTSDDDEIEGVLVNSESLVCIKKHKKLGIWHYDLLEVNPTKLNQKPKVLVQGKNKIATPFVGTDNKIGYVEYEEGVTKINKVSWDSVVAFVDTSVHYRMEPKISNWTEFPFNGMLIQWDPQSQSWFFEHELKGFPFLVELKETPSESAFGKKQIRVSWEKISLDTLERIIPIQELSKINIHEFEFSEDRKSYVIERETISIDGSEKTDKSSANFQYRRNGYEVNYATDMASLKLENSFASSFYQNANTGPQSVFPGVSALTRVSISDLMEDYRLVAGVRIAADIKNSDFGVSFENNKLRWDKVISLQRRSQRWDLLNGSNRTETYMVTYSTKYPIDEVQSVKFDFSYRLDRKIQLSSDPVNLALPNYNENNLGCLITYTLDNTRPISLNLREGLRGKVWIERYQRAANWNARKDINVVGGDIRFYKKIHRSIITATRFAGACSFGQQRVVHYLGGVDNWLGQKVNTSVPVSDTMNYRFSSFAGPMRGFYVNSRNGSSFVLVNNEVRVPVFSYLSRKTIRSEFIRHFQVIGFFDVGSAWTGKSPYSVANGFNFVSESQSPVTVTVHSNRNPLIYGYGFGLHSKISSYFVRFDWAWGVDDKETLPRVFYLSLNADF